MPNPPNAWATEKGLGGRVVQVQGELHLDTIIKQELDAGLHQFSITTCWNSRRNFCFGWWKCYGFLGPWAGVQEVAKQTNMAWKNALAGSSVFCPVWVWINFHGILSWGVVQQSLVVTEGHHCAVVNATQKVQAKVGQAWESLHSWLWHSLRKTPDCVLTLNNVTGNVKKDANAGPKDLGLVWDQIFCLVRLVQKLLDWHLLGLQATVDFHHLKELLQMLGMALNSQFTFTHFFFLWCGRCRLRLGPDRSRSGKS